MYGLCLFYSYFKFHPNSKVLLMHFQLQVADILSVLWRVLEPMLYAFIGAEIDVRVLDIPTVTWGVAVIMGALAVSILSGRSTKNA